MVKIPVWEQLVTDQSDPIYSLGLLVDFSSVCCSLSHWLSWDNRSKIPAQTLIYVWMFASP